ncbi:MAG: hypothetical protein HZT40_12450 [Candidatus Thiothrix singaporensis]|uniref:Uncharacterized protein n=1 Tax=Candidatus Thiothrix singaporensis TaxID=2799669 RepID=A0A7L6AT43_9GAMM|nr:MAG: hypothetical protein HZT40_12450 [Candidatus Thiothrix singaporensis]
MESDKLNKILASMQELEKRVVQGGLTIAQERAKANAVIRVVLVLLACLALLNLHFMHVMTQEFRTMIKDMVSMHEYFGQVAERMNDMTGYVANMEEDIKLMPVINAQMTDMNKDVSGMQASLAGMTANVAAMHQHVGSINQESAAWRSISVP